MIKILSINTANAKFAHKNHGEALWFLKTPRFPEKKTPKTLTVIYKTFNIHTKYLAKRLNINENGKELQGS